MLFRSYLLPENQIISHEESISTGQSTEPEFSPFPEWISYDSINSFSRNNDSLKFPVYTENELESVAIHGQNAHVISIWYGTHQKLAHPGAPQDLYNVLGNLRNPEHFDSLFWSLNGTSKGFLTILPVQNIRLALPGDFNAEIPLSELYPGKNTVSFTASHKSGQKFSKHVTLDYRSGGSWPLPFSINWQNVSGITEATFPVDGFWTLGRDGVRSIQPHYDRVLAVGDTSWTDYEVTVPITVHSVHHVNLKNPPCVGILLRWDGHEKNGNEQPGTIWYPIGAMGIFRWYTDSNGPRFQIYENLGYKTSVSDTTGRKMNIGTTYIFKMSVQTIPGEPAGLYKFKVWQQGDAEPGTWDLVRQAKSGLTKGSILLLAHYVDATFGNFLVTKID